MSARVMRNVAQASLPGVGFAEQCIARCRALFKRDEIRDPAKLDPGAFLWECAFEVKDRRFVCRLARVPVELAERDWRELLMPERMALLAAVQGVFSWTARHRAAVARLQRERLA
jgi:hypothetical protein